MGKITKLFTTKNVEVDEKNRTAKFIISDDGVDRMDERVEQSWDLKNYEANPIVLWGHDPSQPENVMGNSLGIDTEKGDDDVTRSSSTVKFSTEGLNAKADMVFNMVKAGILRTVSVGFIPKTFKEDEDGHDILADNELLEFSIVPIPANPRAVTLGYKEGAISKKDARYMLESMKKESKLLQDELDNDKKDNKEKDMSDEDIAKLAEALGTKIGETLAPITEKLDAILEKVGADDEGTDNPDENENPAGDEEEENPTKSAKGGENDQPGADDVDEDTELTPEQEKEFEKEFAKSLEKELA